MLSRGYVSIKLDVAVDASASVPGAGSLQARIDELEAEIKELKEDRAHWKRVCEVTEATHVELMEMRSDSWRVQLETMRMKLVEAEKAAEDSRKRIAAVDPNEHSQKFWADAITITNPDCPDRAPNTHGPTVIKGLGRNSYRDYLTSPTKNRVRRLPKKFPGSNADAHQPPVEGAQTTPPTPPLSTTDSPSDTSFIGGLHQQLAIAASSALEMQDPDLDSRSGTLGSEGNVSAGDPISAHFGGSRKGKERALYQ